MDSRVKKLNKKERRKFYLRFRSSERIKTLGFIIFMTITIAIAIYTASR